MPVIEVGSGYPFSKVYFDLLAATTMKIWVVDNGGQWTHREWRVLRYLKQDTKMIPNTTPVQELLDANLDGLLLSGGAPRAGVENDKLGLCGEYLDALDIPILGICAGHQFMARHFGGDAGPGKEPEFGAVEMRVTGSNPIVEGIPETSTVWASHHDEVTTLPAEFDSLASSDACAHQIVAHKTRPLYGVQFHPEVEHTECGVQLFENFIGLCESKR